MRRAALFCVFLALGFGGINSGYAAEKKVHPRLKKLKIPEGKKYFIDSVGPYVAPADGNDISLRFVAGEEVPISEGMNVLQGSGIEPWYLNIKSYLNEHTQIYQDYTKAPAPPLGSIPFRIVRNNDINCVIANKSKNEFGKTENTDLFGFIPSNNKPSPPKPAENAPPPEPEAPPKVEMQCTDLAIQQIGGESSEALKGDTQISFLIAHEVSHILLGHFKAHDVRAKRQKSLYELLNVTANIITFATAKYTRNGNNITATTTDKTSKGLTAAILVTYAINDLNVAILGPKWARDQEFEADLLAVDLLKLQKQDPSQALGMFEKFSKAQKEIKKKEQPFIEKLGVILTSQALSDAQSGKSGEAILNNLLFQAALVVYRKWRETSIGFTHDNYEDRMALINEYVSIYYPVDTSELSSKEEDTSGEANKPKTIPKPDPAKLYGVSLWDGKTFMSLASNEINAYNLLTALSSLSKGKTCDVQKEVPLSETLKTYVADAALRTDLIGIENLALGLHTLCKTETLSGDSLEWAAGMNKAVSYLVEASKTMNDTRYFTPLVEARLALKQYDNALIDIDMAERRGVVFKDYVQFKLHALNGLERKSEAEILALKCKETQEKNLGVVCMILVGKDYEGNTLPPPPATTETQKSPQDFLRLVTNTPKAPSHQDSADEKTPDPNTNKTKG